MKPELTLAPDETLLARPRPSLWMLLIDGLPSYAAFGLLLAGGLLLWAVSPAIDWAGLVVAVLAAIGIAAALAWRCLDLMCRDYVLTDRRVVVRSGVLNRVVSEAPLTKVQNTALVRTWLERLLGVGTIGFSTAGGHGFEVVWRIVDDPTGAMSDARAALDAHHKRPNTSAMPAAASQRSRSPRTLVIGMAGGIGAGKSAAAAAFAQLGCVVIDSDARAKAALDRPDVRSTLISRWGEQVLDASGKIDRAKVAEIIFADPAQRRLLEELVHPIVRQDRAAIIRELDALPQRPPAVVIDAPLLFEAGLDAECDAVVFVDAPRADRLARVQRTRGWDDAELTRREAAQWDAEKKRAASRFVINNPDPPADLVPEARGILAQLGNLPPGPRESST